MALTGGPTVTLRFKGDADDLHRSIAGIRTGLAGIATAGVGMGATVGALGAIGAAASAVVVSVAAVPAAFLGIGIAAAAQSEQVKTAFSTMKDHVVSQVQQLAQPIEAELLRTADSIEAAFNRIAPALGRIFEMTAPHLKLFTDGMISLVENAMPGFEEAIRNSTPLVESFSRGLGTLGTGIGQFFAELTKGTPGAVAGMDALFKLTQELLQYLGQLVGQLANSLGPAFAALEPSIMQVVRALGDGLLAIANALGPKLGELGHTIADLVTAAIQALIPVVQEVLPFLADMANTVGQALLPVIEALAPVLATVAKELVEGLRPVIPVVAQAFRDMEPTIRQIAEQAGPLLAEVIRTLGPLFLELVKGALELTEALLPVIPPLLEMANNAMPLVAGVINDVVIPAIKFLVTEFKGLIDFGVKLVDSWGEMSQRWRTYWDEIKAAFTDADNKIKAGIDAWVGLGEKARVHWDAMVQAIKQKITEIVAEATALPGKVIGAIGDMATSLREKGAAAMQGFLDGLTSLVEKCIEFVRTIPGKVADAIAGAVSGAASSMYNSGASMIDGFNKGIESKVDAARQAGTVAVDAASNPFPQSPAKEGPLSGQGWTFFRGQSMIQGFIDGITSMWGKLRETMAGGSIGAAADELVNQFKAGGQIFEDLSFRGMSGNLGQWNDKLSSMLGGGPISLQSLENLARSAKVGVGPGGVTASAGGLELRVAPGADSALSSMLMNLVRTGQLQLARA